MKGNQMSIAKRDEDRDSERDETRDRQRDAARDTGRDNARDARHDEYVRSTFESEDVPLIVAMAEQCSDLIRAWDEPPLDQPVSLQLKHLEWMCDQVAERAGGWRTAKLHRWIGFIQAGLIANRMVQLEGAKRMFDKVKRAQPGLDPDLLDHLNPDCPFELDIGGQG